MNVAESGMNIANMQGSTYTQVSSQSSAEINTSAPEKPTTQSERVQTEINESSQKQQTEEQKQKLNELAQQLNKELSPLNTNVTFGFNEDIEGLFVTVSEKDTNKVIRKIPSDEAMRLMAKMREIVGIIFDRQA